MNILIVDDEPMIREWFRMTVDKLGDGYRIAGEAANGREALEFVRLSRVDLVVTDVKMPGMDGIELLKRLREEDPGVRTVIFSSYNEFQFAAEALKFGACDYILKAEVTLEGLREILMKIKRDMELESSRSVEIDSLRHLVKMNEITLRSAYFKELLQGSPAAIQSFAEQMRLHRIKLSTKHLTVMALGIIRNPEREEELKIKEESLRQLAVVNIINETLDNEAGNGCAVPDGGDVYFLLLNIESNGMKSQREILLLAANRIAGNLQRYIGAECAIGISTAYSQLIFLPEQATEAREALRHNLFYGDRSIVFPKSLREAEPPAVPDLGDFNRSLELGRTADARKEYERIMDGLAKDKQLAANKVRALVQEMLYASLGKARLSGVPAEMLDTVYDELAGAIQRQGTVHQLRAWSAEILGRILEGIDKSRRRYGEAVQAACDYIQAHCQEEIKLQQMADQVHLSRNYFSELFKKETGLNFNDYLMQARMEKAKEALKLAPVKITDLAGQLGYANASYFIKLFKSYTGLSPHEYREAHQVRPPR